MRTMLLLFGINLVILLKYSYNKFAGVCPLYKCDEFKVITESNVCMKASKPTLSSETIYYFKDCIDENSFCDFDPNDKYNNNDVAYCKQNEKSTKLLGYNRKCKENSECMTGECKKHKCTGRLVNETCNSDEICSHGLYCDLPLNNNSTSSLKCLKVKPDDKILPENITDDMLKCSRNEECAYDRMCLNNRCTLPFTKKDGEEATLKIECNSNLVVERTRNDGSKYFICDRYLLQNSTYDCNDDQEFCTYKYNVTKTTFNQNCTCSKTETQKRRCPTDYSVDRLNEMTYDYITISDENTVYRNINNWNQLNFKQHYPDLDMNQCVADVLDKNSNYLKSISIILTIMIAAMLF